MKKLLAVLSIACLATTLTSCGQTTLPTKEIVNIGDVDESQIINLNKKCIQEWAAPGAKTIADLESHFSDTFTRSVQMADGNVDKELKLSPSLINEESGQYITIKLAKDAENVRTILTKIDEKDFQQDNTLKTEIFKLNFHYLSSDAVTAKSLSRQAIYTLYDESFAGGLKNPELITHKADGTPKESWEYNQYLVSKYTSVIDPLSDIGTLNGKVPAESWDYTAEPTLDINGDCIRKEDIMTKNETTGEYEYTKDAYLSTTYVPMLVSCYTKIGNEHHLQKMTVVFAVLDYAIVYKTAEDERDLIPDWFYNITYTDNVADFTYDGNAVITNEMYGAGKIFDGEIDKYGSLE